DTEDTEKERSHPLNSQTAIAPLNSQTAIALFNLPNSDRTPSTSPNSDRILPTPQTAIAPPQPPKQRSHFLNSPKAIASPQLPKHSFFNEPQRHRGHREREIALPLTSQTA
ncbi:hypothetical protein, partial [Aphanizomenon flos-aquae]|uniref:hypothetical protein n=1 Tax=Aphanizomenon flos-aquae TaxID=1176 RepID=UPI001363B2B7